MSQACRLTAYRSIQASQAFRAIPVLHLPLVSPEPPVRLVFRATQMAKECQESVYRLPIHLHQNRHHPHPMSCRYRLMSWTMTSHWAGHRSALMDCPEMTLSNPGLNWSSTLMPKELERTVSSNLKSWTPMASTENSSWNWMRTQKASRGNLNWSWKKKQTALRGMNCCLSWNSKTLLASRAMNLSCFGWFRFCRPPGPGSVLMP